MPRALKTDKFYLYAAGRSGYWRDKRLLGVNPTHEGGTEGLTVQDLLDFLKEKGVSPSTVVLPSAFITHVRL